MTENGAKEILNQIATRNIFCTLEEKELSAFYMATQALEEIQQYRALGTVEELKEAKEKQIPKKPVCKEMHYSEEVGVMKMQNDLISRSALIEDLKWSCGMWKKTAGVLIRFIEKQPAAYDMDAVVQRLEEMFKHHSATKTVKRLVLETVRNGIKR